MITERIDHTLLRADATEEDIRGLCEEAVTYGFHSVCVNSSCVALCASLLKNTGIKVCTVIGFPLGAMSTTAKIAETTAAVKDGAEELDMVIHIGALKSGPSLDLSGLLWKNQAVREGAYLLLSSDDTSSGCSKDRIY